MRSGRVCDGQYVKASDPILVLGDVGVESDRNRLASRIYIERAAQAHLDAEQSLANTLVFATDLLAAAQQYDRVQQGLVYRDCLVRGAGRWPRQQSGKSDSKIKSIQN